MSKYTAEPVAYAVFSETGNIRIWSADPIQVERLRQEYGDQVQALYAAPQTAERQPTPDVSALVEALESARVDLRDWMVSFEEDADLGDTKRVLAKIDAALAAHQGRKIGNDQ